MDWTVLFTFLSLIVAFISLSPIVKKILLDRSRKKAKEFLFNREPLTQNFVGRNKEIEFLFNWYRDEHKKIISIVGLGGQGKTILLTHWLQNPYLQKSKALWWSVSENASIDSLFEQLLYFYGETHDEYLNSNILGKLKRLKEYIRKKNRLIIIDGFEKFLNNKCEIANPQLKDLILHTLKSTKSKIAISSRCRVVNLEGLNGCSIIELQGLTNSDVIQYFKLNRVEIDNSTLFNLKY